ncbi:MAG: UDP-N-acetylmuramoyl-L-alanine--D-glutamate ligase [Rhodobacteraceae bacterium]|nr:UDP-N-acetylmuramoyl-L-alanine--D-glutamate ligase [Paracoccaceae bacterium]MCY4197592.1 UDP-N-acetylmuramoyl-L-alanine--D-glutamate ligase [Paracoccaceae bacterium]
MGILEHLRGRRYAVLGLGRTGTAAAHFLTRMGAEVWCWDDSDTARKRAWEQGITLHELGGMRDWDSIACLVVSPGIPFLYPQPHPIVNTALRAGVPLDNDIGLYFSNLQQMSHLPTTVAVTGSNGKSTTAALIHSILSHLKRLSRLVGNFGESVLAGDPIEPGETVVLELSSYQGELARRLQPTIAVFLNFSEDHLDRHGGLGGYFAAKSRVFNMSLPQWSVVGVDEQEGHFLAAQCQSPRLVRISSSQDLSQFDDAVFTRDGNLVSRMHGQSTVICRLTDMPGLSGPHNHQNACAASAVCHALGLSNQEIAAGLCRFTGLPHRSQVVGRFNGILCINDSKATNAVSAGMALEAFPRIRWIAGGLGKEGGISILQNRLNNVIKAYLVGQSAPEFAAQLGATPHVICETVSRAVELAWGEARNGETLLFSPAAASFDQYPDFEARGDHFVSEVKRCFARPES